MPLLDLTAELMGDPSASYRRAPTKEEMNRSDRWNTWDFAFKPETKRFVSDYNTGRPSMLRGLQVGKYIVKQSKSSADHAIKNLRNYGMNAIRKRTEDGNYLVIRTK